MKADLELSSVIILAFCSESGSIAHRRARAASDRAGGRGSTRWNDIAKGDALMSAVLRGYNALIMKAIHVLGLSKAAGM